MFSSGYIRILVELLRFCTERETHLKRPRNRLPGGGKVLPFQRKGGDQTPSAARRARRPFHPVQGVLAGAFGAPKLPGVASVLPGDEVVSFAQGFSACVCV